MGASLLTESRRLRVRTGPLSDQGMTRLMADGYFAAVIDATHPYAQAASRNIRAAARAASLPYLRLLRPQSQADCLPAYPHIAAAVDALIHTEGPILAATGAKELEAYTRIPDFARRVYPRVLPTVESVDCCIRLGFSPSHIIAMQGPFGYALNRAMMEQCGIRHLVTKDGGAAGGFEEKVDAARSLGITVRLIARPPETEGLSQDELLPALSALLGLAP